MLEHIKIAQDTNPPSPLPLGEGYTENGMKMVIFVIPAKVGMTPFLQTYRLSGIFDDMQVHLSRRPGKFMIEWRSRIYLSSQFHECQGNQAERSGRL